MILFTVWCETCHSNIEERLEWGPEELSLASHGVVKHVCTRCPDCDKLISNYFGHNCKPYWKRENQ